MAAKAKRTMERRKEGGREATIARHSATARDRWT